MKLIKPSVEIIDQKPEIQGIYEAIEEAGRTCYRSSAKYDYFDLSDRPNKPIDRYLNNGMNLTKEEAFEKGLVVRKSSTAEDFVNRMIKSGHGAMLEHGTIYLLLPENSYNNEIHSHYMYNPYSRCKDNDLGEVFITTNYRVIVENGWYEDLQYVCEPTEYHEKRVTVKFTTQIAITREANRHRVNSMAESSTRYCNYSKDKFGSEISINLPTFIDESELDMEYPSFRGLCHAIYDEEDDVIFSALTYWRFANLACEYSYMNLIRLGWRPEQARTILPLDTNSELVHTAFISDWEHFFELRYDKAAHQDIRALAIPLKDKFKELNLI